MPRGSKGDEKESTCPDLELPPRPQSSEELRRLLKSHLGLSVPAKGVCPTHRAPMDYVWHAFRAGAPNALVWACRGGGKTMLAAAATVAESLYTAGLETRILGGSLAQSSYMYNYVCLFLRRPQLEGHLANLTRQRATLANGSAIEVLPQSERTVRGVHVPRLKLDEVDEFREDVFRASLFLPQRMNGIPARTDLLSTMHKPYGLMMDLVDRREASGLELFQWCLWEIIEACRDRSCGSCPLEKDCLGRAKEADGYFSIDDAIARKRLVSEESWESEMLSKRPSREGLFYKSWDESVHVAPEPIGYDPGWQLYRSFDWGTNAPTVCLWIQVAGDERVRVIDELYQCGMAASDMAEGVLRRERERKYPGATVSYCDPSGLTYIEEFRKHGIHTESRREGGGPVNARSAGFETVRRFLKLDESGKAKLLVSPRCEGLIREFRAYHYPTTRPGFNPSEEPVKVNDHALDALRYFFALRFPQSGWELSRAD